MMNSIGNRIKGLTEREIDLLYAAYIFDNCGGDRSIGNGVQLIEAMESGYLWPDFLDFVQAMPIDYLPPPRMLI